MMLMHDDACCMMMRDRLSLRRVSNEQDYDAQHDVAEHPQDAPCDAILRLEISQLCIDSKPASPTSVVN